MTCSGCKAAAELNKRGLYMMQQNKLKQAEELFRLSEEMHDECKGCTCQHDTRRSYA